MSVRKVLSLAVSSTLFVSPLVMAKSIDINSMVDQNFSVVPDSSLKDVSKNQIVPAAVDVAAFVALRILGHVKDVNSAKNIALIEKLNSETAQLSLELDINRRKIAENADVFRARLQAMDAAIKIGHEREDYKAAKTELDAAQLQGATQEEVASLTTKFQNAAQAYSNAVAALTDENHNPLTITPADIENIGDFSSRNALANEYTDLVVGYTDAVKQGQAAEDQFLAKLAKDGQAGVDRLTPQLEKVDDSLSKAVAKSGAFKRFFIQPVAKGLSLVVIADLAGRAYLLYGSHRDPGLSPAASAIKALYDSQTK